MKTFIKMVMILAAYSVLPLQAAIQSIPPELNDNIKQGLESLTKKPDQRDNGNYRIYDGSNQRHYRERFGRSDQFDQTEQNYQNRYQGNATEKFNGETFKERFGHQDRLEQDFGVQEKKLDEQSIRPGLQRFYGDRRYDFSRDPNIETKLSKPGELKPQSTTADNDKKTVEKPKPETQATSMQTKPGNSLSDTGHKE